MYENIPLTVSKLNYVSLQFEPLVRNKWTHMNSVYFKWYLYLIRVFNVLCKFIFFYKKKYNWNKLLSSSISHSCSKYYFVAPRMKSKSGIIGVITEILLYRLSMPCQIYSTLNRPACMKILMTIVEAKEVCKNRNDWRSIISAYPYWKQTLGYVCM